MSLNVHNVWLILELVRRKQEIKIFDELIR